MDKGKILAELFQHTLDGHSQQVGDLTKKGLQQGLTPLEYIFPS